MAAMPPPKYVPVLITSLAVAVLEFSLGRGGTRVATLSSGGHTTNTFVLNYTGYVIIYLKL